MTLARGHTKDAYASYFESKGSGSPVILVHGLGMNHRMWDWQWDAMTDRFLGVRFDLIGHGGSTGLVGSYRIDSFVEQLLGVAAAVGLERFALVGFSLGGLIAQATALAHPERVERLAILHAAHDRSDAERAAIRERVEKAARHGPAGTIDAALQRWFTPEFSGRCPEVLDRVRGWIESNDRDAYVAAYRVLAESDAALAKEISHIACPTFVMTGEDDSGNTPAMARRMAAMIPAARCEILPGLRHMALAEDPARVSSALIHFLESGTSTQSQ